MGKFNSSDGVNFSRTLQDVVNDYARFLYDRGLISDDEMSYYVTTPDGRNEVMDILFEKLYETEIYRGIEVSTLDSFYHFCHFIIKEYNRKEVWNDFVKEMFLTVEHNKDIAIMATRGIGKSFFLYTLYPQYKMFLHRGTKFLHISNIPTQCIENLRINKSVIDSNEVLYMKKEVWKGKELKWTERQIEYNGGMLLTVSAGTSPRGQHVHYCILDDIITEGCQLNDEEAREYLYGQAYPTVQRLGGRMIVSGTPIHIKDLYHFIMGDKKDFQGTLIRDGRFSAENFYCKTYPALKDTGEAFLPEVYPIEVINQIRNKIGEIKFQREYMLNCTDESMTIFSDHLLASVSDANEKYLYSASGSLNRFIIGVDVATSGHASADFSAFIVLEIVPSKDGYKKIVRHVIHEKGMPIAEQINTIQLLSRDFNNARVVVEKNNVGVALIQELINRGVYVDEFVTTSEKKTGMIRYLENSFKNKNLLFCEETNVITKLKKELRNFGVKITRSGKEKMEALSGHDDLVMSLAMANQAAQDGGSIPFAITI